MVSLASGMMFIPAMPALGQGAAGQSQPLIQDWTTHHVIFSSPGSADDAIRAGKYEQWLKIVNDPRYIMQQRRRSIHASGTASTHSQVTEPASLKGESGADIEAAGVAAAATEMTFEEREILQGGNRNLPSGLMRALIPPSGTQRPGLALGVEPSIGNITKNGMRTDWGENMASGATIGLGDFPATYTTTATSCTADFAVFNTGLTGSSSQASIIAYNELYTGCPGRPSTYWAYNTAAGTIINGVDLSVDGTQVGFVQTEAGVATLVLLKWAAGGGGTISAPTTPTAVATNAYRSCPAPCMTTITFSGTNPTDTYSFPYYDYGSDTIYVGDDVGKLHKFTNIFLSGTPAEAGSPWPVTVFNSSSGLSALGSPVYDSVDGNVFVGDYLLNAFSNCEPSANTVNGSCGYLYSVNTTSGTVVQSADLDKNIGILDSPIVDSSAGEVYVFVGDDGSTACSGSTPCAGVFQFPVNFTAAATGTEATVGPGYEFMMSGSFDNAYFTTGTGHLYVVGNTGPADNTLYQIKIASNVMSTIVAGPVVGTNYDNSYYAAGLQVTEFLNGSTDYIFLSVLAFGSPTGDCGALNVNNGCVLGFNVTSGTISPTTTPTGGSSEAGGTSGIVVDNAAVGASNIYFSTLLNSGAITGGTCTTSGGTGGCAVQLSQVAP